MFFVRILEKVGWLAETCQSLVCFGKKLDGKELVKGLGGGFGGRREYKSDIGSGLENNEIG